VSRGKLLANDVAEVSKEETEDGLTRELKKLAEHILASQKEANSAAKQARKLHKSSRSNVPSKTEEEETTQTKMKEKDKDYKKRRTKKEEKTEDKETETEKEEKEKAENGKKDASKLRETAALFAEMPFASAVPSCRQRDSRKHATLAAQPMASRTRNKVEWTAAEVMENGEEDASKQREPAALFAKVPFASALFPLSHDGLREPAALAGSADAPRAQHKRVWTATEMMERLSPLFQRTDGEPKHPGETFVRSEELDVLEGRLRAARPALVADYKSKQRTVMKRAHMAHMAKKHGSGPRKRDA
jgi:hypothetical protein